MLEFLVWISRAFLFGFLSLTDSEYRRQRKELDRHNAWVERVIEYHQKEVKDG
jgi:hypothetical protein